VAAQHVRSETGAFFVGEDADGDRTVGGDPGGPEYFDHFQTGEHTEVSVVAAASADGVDVGAAHDRRAIDLTGHRGDHIADGINSDRHVEIGHQCRW